MAKTDAAIAAKYQYSTTVLPSGKYAVLYRVAPQSVWNVWKTYRLETDAVAETGRLKALKRPPFRK
jgi:hypothetical protein